MSNENEKQIKYDIFISFKNSDGPDGLVYAKDRALAEKYYNLLTDEGFKVFFSPESIDKEGSDKWKEAINRAVDTCDVLIVIGCSRENMESKWIEYEWDRFLRRMDTKTSGNFLRLYIVYSGMREKDLPSKIKEHQAFDDVNNPKAFEKILESIRKGLNADKEYALNIKKVENFINRAKQKITFGYERHINNDLNEAEKIIKGFGNKPDKARISKEIANIRTEYEKIQNQNYDNICINSYTEQSEGVLNNISKDIVKGKFERKFYFDRAGTLMMPFAFIYLFLFVLLQQIEHFSIRNYNSPDIYGIIFWMFWVFLLVIFAVICFVGYMFINRSKVSKIELPPFIINKFQSGKGEVLSRVEKEKQLNEFFHETFYKDNYAFVVGKSGSGKTFLVREYANTKRAETNTFVEDFGAPDYLDKESFQKRLEGIIGEKCEGEKNEGKKCIIIFDQFERAFKDKDIFYHIKKFILYLRESKNTRVSMIFVCTTDTYSEINEDFEFSIKKEIKGDKVHFDFDAKFIKFTEDEMISIMNQLLRNGESEKYKVYFEGMFDDLINNNATMIDLNIVRVFFGRQDKGINDEIKQKIQNYSNSRDLIWDEYFEQVFAQLESPELAMVVLYAICKYPDGLTTKDFQNLTFVNEGELTDKDGILSTLERLKIIDEVKKVGKDGHSSYIMTHDRLIEYLETHCKGKLYEKVTQNIDFYCKEKEKDKKTHNKSSVLSYYYEKTINNQKSSKGIAAAMITLYVSVFVTSVWLVSQGYGAKTLFGLEYQWDIALHLLTIVAIFMAIYYIYHYLQYYAKIFLSKKRSFEFFLCLLLIAWGMVSVNLALILNGLFAVWLAIEWFFIGILHVALSNNIHLKENTRDLIRSEGRLYIYISLVLIVFNVGILWLAGTQVHEILLKYLGIPMFILFTFDLIRRHVQRDWMLSKVGSFVNISMKEKEETK